MRLCDRNSSADTKVSKERGGGGAPDAGAEIPLQLMMKDLDEAVCPPAAHGGPWWSRYPPMARGRDPKPEQVIA